MSLSSFISLFVIFLSQTILVSCSFTEHIETIPAVAWSDDSEEIAFIFQKYEITNVLSVTSGEKNPSYQIRIVNRDGSNLREIGNYFSNYGNEIFYKQLANYFVVSNQESILNLGNIKSDVNIPDYYIINLDGEIIKELVIRPEEYCDKFRGNLRSIRVVPSPNGDTLAVVKSTVDCTLSIDLQDAKNEFSSSQKYLVEGNDIVGLFWGSNHTLLVNACIDYSCNPNWYVFNLIGELKHISLETFNSLCLGNITISPDLNMDSEKIVWIEPGKAPQIKKNQKYEGNELGIKGSIVRDLDNPENCIDVDEV